MNYLCKCVCGGGGRGGLSQVYGIVCVGGGGGGVLKQALRDSNPHPQLSLW